MTIRLDQEVSVKLTPLGWQVLREYYNKGSLLAMGPMEKYFPQDGEGMVKFVFWQLIDVFGKMLSGGFSADPPVIEKGELRLL